MGLTVDKSELKINFHKIDERYLITLFDKQNTKKEIDKIHKINYYHNTLVSEHKNGDSLSDLNDNDMSGLFPF